MVGNGTFHWPARFSPTAASPPSLWSMGETRWPSPRTRLGGGLSTLQELPRGHYNRGGEMDPSDGSSRLARRKKA